LRESKGARRERANEIFDLLLEEYPDARCALEHRNAYELLVATILSAQCTDARVNRVTPSFFQRFPDAKSLSEARQEEVEQIIHSTGFFRNKAKSLIGMGIEVVEHHGGEIPRTMKELVRLPGVGRKTANVVLGNAYGIADGVVVDTHVGRLSRLLRLTREKSPEKVERDLMELFPQERWTLLSHLFIFHGRAVCVARSPRCEGCVLSHLCPSSRV
jgi:endonuclease-3